MRSTFNIKDAREDLKALNNFLVELGTEVAGKQADPRIMEELMNDPEFSRLMSNIRFFQVEGNAYLAGIYESMAQNYKQKAER